MNAYIFAISALLASHLHPEIGLPFRFDALQRQVREPSFVSLPLGEEVDGYPVWEERMILYLTNMIRCDPQNASPPDVLQYVSSGPMGPVAYNAELNEAARFHADDMRVNGCFQHESCDGTQMVERVSRFYTGFSAVGENIAMGQTSPEQAMDAWMHSMEGHRENILTPDWNELGAGYAQASSKWWVQDFGAREEVILHGILNGVVYPKKGRDMGRFTFGVNFIDDQGRDPLDVEVVIDSGCFPLRLVMGAPANGVFEAQYALTAGCREFYFFAVDADNVRWTFPEKGSLIVPVGQGQDCDAYTTARREARCLGGGGDGGCAAAASGAGATPTLLACLGMLAATLLIRRRKNA